ncbi:MAG: hypothetical protein M3Q14_02615 [bacterium]|nr:hypothetical protein [bacterium]
MKSRVLRAGLVLVLAALLAPAAVSAQFESTNYEINEVLIGTGGEIDACGTAYCADQSAGSLGVGNANSTNYRADTGYFTEADEQLEVTVTNTNIDLGVLNTSGTAAQSANFSVKNYLSSGYIVKVYGDTPTNYTGPGTHALTALNSPSASAIGTEQFGINLVSNTTPGIGTNPQQIPDSSFSYGQASVGYNTADTFKYIDGDTIAQSNQATGQTNYTMSIIANVATSTPGGQYVTTLVIQVIATF